MEKVFFFPNFIELPKEQQHRRSMSNKASINMMSESDEIRIEDAPATLTALWVPGGVQDTYNMQAV